MIALHLLMKLITMICKSLHSWFKQKNDARNGSVVSTIDERFAIHSRRVDAKGTEIDDLRQTVNQQIVRISELRSMVGELVSRQIDRDVGNEVRSRSYSPLLMLTGADFRNAEMTRLVADAVRDGSQPFINQPNTSLTRGMIQQGVHDILLNQVDNSTVIVSPTDIPNRINIDVSRPPNMRITSSITVRPNLDNQREDNQERNLEPEL